MSELRKHYFLDEYCIIAAERGRRPSDFISEPEISRITDCAFCGGNEDKTPPATAVYRDGKVLKDTDGERVKDWQIRCFPNLYPALSPDAGGTKREGGLQGRERKWQVREGYGFHEVIVETPRHGKTLPDLTDDETGLLMRAYRDRVVYHRSQRGIAYVSLFKNSGKSAGASLEHAHSQLIALPVQPPILQQELSIITHLDECPYCTIARTECESPRLVTRTRDWVAFTPFCSRFPFEVWLMPFEHIPDLVECPEIVIGSLGIILRDVIRMYRQLLGDMSYNYMFFQGPGPYHLNLRIQPVLTTIAG
ncbi:MAG: sulfate adenylyltransferase, partial [ANME-2 cluster archaeon]|nr:sulfate adenylyltransferase [ANME-2 cluster archaeon]